MEDSAGPLSDKVGVNAIVITMCHWLSESHWQLASERRFVQINV